MRKWWENLKKQLLEKSYKDVFSILFSLQVSLFSFATGSFLILKGDAVAEGSDTYKLMDGLMNMDTWGLFFIVSSVLILISISQTSKAKYINMLIGGIIGVFILFLYASASAEGQSQWLLPVRYGLSACFNLFIAGVGGFELWKLKNN
ncbi:TPA: hypothetical protein UPI96_002082 [Listeria monocytogenes]|nr:hypothetical protein [Listeria monocytogenes]HAB0362922.1 hypothetical protein [Listeria monocytogenes]HAC4124177.1 hypothetical protein [Listeria monocytogenes]HAC4146428.1 hypothetical protein [Listeria monocytogenes]HEL6710753.1 hypothetical protein [Listeria monocytogenes]